MAEPLLRISHLTKKFGDTTVVDDLSLEIMPGECLGVIGPNGAGKTTTIRVCLGLSGRDGGVIIIVSPCYEGLSVTHENDIRRVGYRSKQEILRLVEEGKFTHRVAAVHMIQVAEATFEKRVSCILVTGGIPPDVIRDVNLEYAPDPQSALAMAFARLGPDASVTVLNRASETLPLIQEH